MKAPGKCISLWIVIPFLPQKAREKAKFDGEKVELEAALEYVLDNHTRIPWNGTNTESYPDSRVFYKDWMEELLQSSSVQTEVQEYQNECEERRQKFLSFVDERRQEMLEHYL